MEAKADLQLPAEWSERAQRLARIVAEGRLAADFPLLKVLRLPEPVAARLENAVAAYLCHTLARAFPNRVFRLDTDRITTYAREILALPNRTPNGVVLARADTFHAFNLVHQALVDAMEAAGLLAHFQLVQVPCNVRVIGGDADPGAEGRSYASSKMHTDLWNGEPVSSILFNIPVLGDPYAVDLRFFEPRAFPPELRGPLRDYSLGAPVTATAAEYPAAFELGRIYISDALSLHQTVKRGPGLRVSVDFRAIARDLLPDETADPGASRAVYVSPERWRAAGRSVILGSGEPLNGFQRRRAGEIVRRETLSIHDIDDAPLE